jgi:hypothetical protein
MIILLQYLRKILKLKVKLPLIQHYNNECTEAVDVIRDQRVIYRTAVCDDI